MERPSSEFASAAAWKHTLLVRTTSAWSHLLLLQNQKPQQSYCQDYEMHCVLCPRRLNSLSCGCSSYSLNLTHLFYSTACNNIPQIISFYTENQNTLSKQKAHLTLQTLLLLQYRKNMTFHNLQHDEISSRPISRQLAMLNPPTRTYLHRQVPGTSKFGLLVAVR